MALAQLVEHRCFIVVDGALVRVQHAVQEQTSVSLIIAVCNRRLNEVVATTGKFPLVTVLTCFFV